MSIADDARPGRIYALTDPRDGAVRYVGKTVHSLERRRRGHLNHARITGRSHCSRWILSLLDQGLEPGIALLEETPPGLGLLNDAERAWIARLRNDGADLCNQTNGGDGGATMTGHTLSSAARGAISAANRKAANPERARKIAESKRRQWQDPEYRERMLAAGRKGSEAAAEKSRGKPGRPHSDETRDKIRQARAQQTFSPETGQKISKALKGTQKTHPPGWADKVRATRARRRAEREGGDPDAPVTR